jgi:hypothetical protein
LHLPAVFFQFLQQFQLRFSPLEVMFGKMDFVIRIAVEVIGEETYRLHVSEQAGAERQVFYFDGQEEIAGCFEVSAGVNGENPYRMPRYLKNGNIDMTCLLEDFQSFWRENSEIWIERYEYKEAAPHLILQAFLQRVVNGGGTIARRPEVKWDDKIYIKTETGDGKIITVAGC